MADPDHVKRMEDQGLQIRPMLAEELTAVWLEQHDKARKYVE